MDSKPYEPSLPDGDTVARLLHHLPIPFLTTDAQGAIQNVNAAAQLLLGQEQADLVGHKITSLIPSLPQHELVQMLHTLSQSSAPEKVQTLATVKGSQDATYPVQLHISAIDWEDGRFYVHALIQTDSQQQAQALQNLQDSLHDFTYLVSHDLRAPLRIISNFGQFLVDDFGDVLGQEGHLYLSGIIENVAYMNEQINSLLTYVRLDSNKENPSIINVHALLTSLINQQFANHQAAIALPSTIPDIYGRQTEVALIFTQLIDNAVKFARDDQPLQITITCHDLGNFVRFAIADNGIGINAQYFSRIFTVFRRLHTSDEYPGTGMGLAIAKKAAEKHGGQISLESEVGKGSTFSVTLPKTAASF